MGLTNHQLSCKSEELGGKDHTATGSARVSLLTTGNRDPFHQRQVCIPMCFSWFHLVFLEHEEQIAQIAGNKVMVVKPKLG